MARPRTGSAVYRHGRWYARVTLAREPKTPEGRAPRIEELVTREGNPVTGQARADEAYAKRYAARLQERYDEGTWSPEGREPPAPKPEVTTVAAWCDEWLARQTYGEAAKDRRRTEAALEGTAFGALAVGAVTPRDVAAWLGEVRSRRTARGGAPAPRTVRNTLDPVARALRSAVFEGLLVADPTAVLPTEHRPQSVDADPARAAGRRLSRAELETLLGEPSVDPRWSVVWHLLALTGAREAEVIALRWGDLLEDEPLHRVRLAEQLHHRTRTREATKTGAVKEVPLHPALGAELARWRALWPEEYGRAAAAADLVVPARGSSGRRGAASGIGGPLWQQDIHRALQRDLTACCLPPHRVHDLRHTFVSLCADAGMAADVATRWTHAPTSTSARHLYLVPSWARQCAEMLKLQVVPRRRAASRGVADAAFGFSTSPPMGDGNG